MHVVALFEQYRNGKNYLRLFIVPRRDLNDSYNFLVIQGH